MTHKFLKQNVANTGHFLHLEEAHFLIIIAEKKRTPNQVNNLVHQSLGHCLQNMWLMATAQNLAFQQRWQH